MKFICVGPGAEEELSEMDTEADAEIFLMWVMDGYGSKSMVTIVWGCLGNKHPLASYFRLPLRYHWDHGHLCKQHEDHLRFRHRPSTNHRRTREGFCGNVWVLWCECVYRICWYLLLFFVRSCCLCVVLVIGDCWCFFQNRKYDPGSAQTKQLLKSLRGSWTCSCNPPWGCDIYIYIYLYENIYITYIYT